MTRLERDAFILAAALMGGVVTGCSSSPPSSVPTSCDPAAQRVGTYLVHFDTVSGNCGALPDQLVIIPSTASSTCTVISATFSDGNCRNDVQEECPSGIQVIGYTVQQSQDGSRITGEESFTSATCVGTYAVTWTRQ
jgi:hypothetical protein